MLCSHSGLAVFLVFFLLLNTSYAEELKGAIYKVGEISKQKCDEYWKNYYNLSATSLGSNTNSHNGSADITLEDTFSHISALGFDNNQKVFWACGGSLISPRFVLTAAHCTYHRFFGPAKYVRLGILLHKPILKISEYKDFNISKIYSHPEYTVPLSYNDIALIELSQIVEMPNLQMACLHVDEQIPTDKKWYSIAWNTRDMKGPPLEILRQMNLVDHPFDKCAKAFNSNNHRKLNRGIDERTQFCAREIGRDSCPGDSGSTVAIRHPDHRFGLSIIGVISFGKPCADITAVVFTKVPAFIEWIEKIVWNDEL